MFTHFFLWKLSRLTSHFQV